MIDFSFIPDPLQGRAIDSQMRQSLAASLEHISVQARGRVPFDEGALERVISDMKAGARYPASTFALYTNTVLALCDGENDRASSLLGRLVVEQSLHEPWRILSLDDPTHSDHLEEFIALIDSDPSTRFAIKAPVAGLTVPFRERFHKSHRLMSSAIPELAAEFDALVSDVVMVAGDERAKYQFDGGSSYMLWGGLFLNVQSHQSEVAMVEVMAHESAHILLYGCAADEALVENEDDELYPSPLRLDPRPMDGIYHAAFVSARMHWTMSRLISSGLLDEADCALAQAARQADAMNFWAGHGVVEQHGRLTRTGSHVMQTARRYMETV